MAFDAHALLVLIASPGDTRDERDAVERALHAWNTDRAARESIVLLPRRWETSAVPRLGARPQGVINQQLVDAADIVIALFDSRLGMETGEAVSGTAEEIERAHEARKPVHVWFSDEPIPRDADLDQVAALRNFKEKLEALGLLGAYSSPEDLAFKVRQAIESDLDELELGPLAGRHPERKGAVLRAHYEKDREQYLDSKNKVKYRTRNERLVVHNSGDANAESVSVSLAPMDGDASRMPTLWGEMSPTIIPESDYFWRMAAGFGSAHSVKVQIAWTEDGQEHSVEQDLAL